MRNLLQSIISVFLFSVSALADDGLISIKSPHDVKNTADQLKATLNAKGMTVFARIDHAGGAQKVGQKLRPRELVIFGYSKMGTPLMQCAQPI